MNKKSKNLATVKPTEAQYSSTQGRKNYIKRSLLASSRMGEAEKKMKRIRRKKKKVSDIFGSTQGKMRWAERKKKKKSATSGADVFGKEQTFFPTLLRKRDSGKPTSIMNKKSKNLATVVPTEVQYSSTQGRKNYIKRSLLASLRMRGAKKNIKKTTERAKKRRKKVADVFGSTQGKRRKAK